MSGDTTPRLNRSFRPPRDLPTSRPGRPFRPHRRPAPPYRRRVRQTWSFDAVIERADGTSQKLALVLRMDPRTEAGQMSRETEFELLKAAYEESVPVAKVHVMGDESLGAPRLPHGARRRRDDRAQVAA